MIYFSDLDKNLIQSKKFGGKQKNEVFVKTLDGEEISYISKKSIEHLKEILRDEKFIPVTDKSIEQFKSIKFKQQGINFEWSIVSNGGNILHNGEIVEEWTKILNSKLKSCGSLEYIIKVFKDKYKDINGISKINEVDNLFFYIVIDKDIFDENNIKVFKEFSVYFGWNLYARDRKIYFVPKVVVKEAAVEFLLNYLNEKKFEVIGDSI